jgi:peptide/nickel transport system permease protein
VGRYLAGRLLQALVTVALVATVTFVLLHLAPGDPVSALGGDRVSVEVRDRLRAQYGLDRPLPEQYARYLASLARGDLGWSPTLNEPVRSALGRALPNTLLLMGAALLLAFAGGIAMGVAQARRPGSWFDRAAGTLSMAVHALPDFWLATILLLALAYWWPLFPAGGTGDVLVYESLSPLGRAVNRLYHVALPAITLALLIFAAVARHQRAALLEVAQEDFVRTARAKGLGERGVLRHALRNALLPVITLLGLAMPALVGGAVFVERVFAWPGMGQLAIAAVSRRDYWVVTACSVVVSAMVAAGTLLADVLHAAADPRLRDG